jgi:hypothetical protein
MGNVYVQATDPDGIDWSSLRLLRYSEHGELLGDVPVPDEKRVPEESFVLMHPSGDLHPFSVATLYAWHPLGSLVVGRNDVYDIRIQPPVGEPSHLIRHLESVSLIDEERAEWEAFATFLNERSQRAGLRVRDYEPIPDTKPYFRGIYAGDDGRIWVLRHVEAVKGEPAPHHGDPNRPPLTWIEPTTFDVFESAGDFLGSVVLPPNTRALAFRGDRVWGVRTDGDGVERVVQLRVALASA